MSKKKRNKRSRNRASASSTPDAKGQATAVAQRPSRQSGGNRPKTVAQLNTKFLAVLAIAGALLAAGIYVLHGYQVKRNSQELLIRANDSIDQGDYEQAIEQLTQYVRLNPDDLDAVRSLGDFVDHLPPTQSSRNRVSNLYSVLIREAPDREDVPALRYRLVRLMLSLGEWSKAEKQISKLLNLSDAPHVADTAADREYPFDRAELLSLRGTCDLRQDRPERALAFMLAAISENPAETEYYTSAITVATELKAQLPERSDIEEILEEDLGSVEAVSANLLSRLPTDADSEGTSLEGAGTAQATEGDETEDDEEATDRPVTEEIPQAAADTLIGYLLQQLVETGRPEYEARLARAEHFLNKVDSEQDDEDDFEQVDAELAQIPTGQQDEPDVILFELELALLKAERLANQLDTRQALDLIRSARKAAERGELRDDKELRYDLLLANAAFQRNRFERDPAARQSAILEARSVVQNALKKLPDLRGTLQKTFETTAEAGGRYRFINDFSERYEAQQKFRLLDRLEIELQDRLIRADLTMVQSENTDRTQVPQISEIDEHIDRLEKLTRDNGSLHYLRAWRDFAVQERRSNIDADYGESAASSAGDFSWGDVVESLKVARVQVADRSEYRRPIDWMLSRCYRELGDTGARLALFRETFERDPSWKMGRLEFARALRDSGQQREARLHYEMLAQQMKLLEAVTELLQLEVRELSKRPAAERDWQPVVQNVSAQREADPDNVALRMLDVGVKVQRGMYDEAERLLTETLELPELSREQQIDVWQSRVFMQLNRKDQKESRRIESATEVWNEARKALPESIEIDLLEFPLAQSRSDEELGAAADRYANALDDYGKSDRITVLEELVRVFEFLDRPDEQTRMWQKLAALQPERLNCQLALCRAALRDENESMFEKHLKEIRRIEGPDGPQGDFLKASWHAWKSSEAQSEGDKDLALAEHQKAVDLLDRVEQQRPRWDRVPVLRFKLAGLLKERDKQAAVAQQAIDLGAGDPEIFDFLIAYLNEENRRREKIDLVERIRRERPQLFTTTLRYELGDHYLRDRQIDAASSVLLNDKDSATHQQELTKGQLKLAEYEKEQIYERTPDPVVLQRLFEQAEAHFLAAIAAAPHERDVWTRAVVFYLRTERVDEAKKIVQRLEAEMPAEPATLKALTLANCYAVLGERALAKEQFRLALAADPDNPAVLQQMGDWAAKVGELKLAREVWETLEDAAKTSSPTLAKRARTLLTWLDALESRTYSEAKKSIDRLEASLPEERDLRLQNLAVQVQILKRFGVHEFQEKLANVLEQIHQTRPLPLSDRLSRITLDKRLKKEDRAESRLQKVLEEEPNSILVRVYAAEHFLTQDDPEKLELAREQVDYLRVRLPKSFVLTGLEAKLAHAEAKLPDAEPEERKRDPGEIIDEYLGRLDDSQNATAIFEDSLARNATGAAFQWLTGVKSLQNPTSYKRIGEAVRLLNEGENNAARALLRPILRQDDVQQAYAALCVKDCSGLLEGFGLLADAERVYRDYLTMSDDEHVPAHLISLLRRQGKVEKAIQYGEQILNKSNAAPVVASLEAILRTQQERVTPEQQQRIKALLDRAIASDSDNVLLLQQIADYCDFIQDYDAAETTYLKILQIQPNNPVALNNLAWLLAMRNQSPVRREQARKMIDHVISIYGPTAELRDTKATVEMSAGNYKGAIDLLKESIEVAPSAQKHFRLSFAQLRAGEKDKARESHRKAVEEGFDRSKLHPLEQTYAQELEGKLLVRR